MRLCFNCELVGEPVSQQPPLHYAYTVCDDACTFQTCISTLLHFRALVSFESLVAETRFRQHCGLLHDMPISIHAPVSRELMYSFKMTHILHYPVVVQACVAEGSIWRFFPI